MKRPIDVLTAQGIALGNYKIHFATKGKGTSPLDAYRQGTFKKWQEEQTRKNFQCDAVVSLIHLEDDRWLFAGAYRILDVEGTKSKFRYKTELLTGQNDLVGRIVVRFKRKFRAAYVWGYEYGSQLEVAELLESPFTIDNIKEKQISGEPRNPDWTRDELILALNLYL